MTSFLISQGPASSTGALASGSSLQWNEHETLQLDWKFRGLDSESVGKLIGDMSHVISTYTWAWATKAYTCETWANGAQALDYVQPIVCSWRSEFGFIEVA